MTDEPDDETCPQHRDTFLPCAFCALARYEKALKRIASLPDQILYVWDAANTAVEIAREALKG